MRYFPANRGTASYMLSGLTLALFFIFTGCQQVDVNSAENDASHSTITLKKVTDGITRQEGVQNSGALYSIAIPDVWNRELVVFAHGYVNPTQPLALPELALNDTTSIEQFFLNMGYAFATSSYSKNGLAVNEGVADLEDLLNIFNSSFGRVKQKYIVGASMGGLVSTFSIEQKYFAYSGGLAVCGPVGDFQQQLDAITDFRVVFDLLFPNVLPGTAVEIPQELIDNFESNYVPAIREALQSNPTITKKLISITLAAINPLDFYGSAEETAIEILRYNVNATNDAQSVLGGQPFDNSEKVYKARGGGMQFINRFIQRFKADETALNEVSKKYQTTGQLFRPLVMVHTVLDPVVSSTQLELYKEKVNKTESNALFESKTTLAYGHCAISEKELTDAFSSLVIKVTGKKPLTLDEIKELDRLEDLKGRYSFFDFLN